MGRILLPPKANQAPTTWTGARAINQPVKYVRHQGAKILNKGAIKRVVCRRVFHSIHCLATIVRDLDVRPCIRDFHWQYGHLVLLAVAIQTDNSMWRNSLQARPA
jgi:hypothetical protein